MRLETFMVVQVSRLRGDSAPLHGGYHGRRRLTGSVEHDERVRLAPTFLEPQHQRRAVMAGIDWSRYDT